MAKGKVKMISIKEFAERSGAKPGSVRAWLSNPEHREKRLPGSELVKPLVGAPYWLIPESVLDSFELMKPGPKPRKKAMRRPKGEA
jgi:hypothetical protein